MLPDSARDPSAPQWTAREAQLLAVTLRLLQQHGYDRLTVEAVATEAKASKATVYRRWPSKAELVVAAFIEGTRIEAAPARSGSLREDLVEIGTLVCQQAGRHAGTLRAVLSEMSRIPALGAALRHDFVLARELPIREALAAAVGRGEIDAGVVSDEICDVLPGYLVFRCVMPGPPPTAETVRALVDEILMPSLTRTRACRAAEEVRWCP